MGREVKDFLDSVLARLLSDKATSKFLDVLVGSISEKKEELDAGLQCLAETLFFRNWNSMEGKHR